MDTEVKPTGRWSNIPATQPVNPTGRRKRRSSRRFLNDEGNDAHQPPPSETTAPEESKRRPADCPNAAAAGDQEGQDDENALRPGRCIDIHV